MIKAAGDPVSGRFGPDLSGVIQAQARRSTNHLWRTGREDSQWVFLFKIKES